MIILNKIFKVRKKQVFYIDYPYDLKPIRPKTDIKLTDITFDNVNHIGDFRIEEEYSITFRKFLEEGQYGIYAWIDSKVVGHIWAKVCEKRHCRVNGYMDVFQNEAFIHFSNVSIQYRGKNIYPTMLNALCQKLLLDIKVRCILIDTQINNKSSLKGIIKVGFKPLKKCTYIQFLGRLIFKYENYY